MQNITFNNQQTIEYFKNLKTLKKLYAEKDAINEALFELHTYLTRANIDLKNAGLTEEQVTLFMNQFSEFIFETKKEYKTILSDIASYEKLIFEEDNPNA